MQESLLQSVNQESEQYRQGTSVAPEMDPEAHSQAEVQEPVVEMVHTVGPCVCGEQLHFPQILGKMIDRKARALKRCLLHLAYSWGQ